MRISDWSSDVCSSDLIGSHRIGGVGILFGLRQVKQLGRAVQRPVEALDGQYVAFQLRTLTPQRLCTLGVVPDIGVFKFTSNFLQTLLLGVEVKETPSATTADPAGRRCAGESD